MEGNGLIDYITIAPYIVYFGLIISWMTGGWVDGDI